MPRAEDETLPRILSLVDRMELSLHHRVCAHINSLESTFSANKTRHTPVVSHLSAEVQVAESCYVCSGQ